MAPRLGFFVGFFCGFFSAHVPTYKNFCGFFCGENSPDDDPAWVFSGENVGRWWVLCIPRCSGNTGTVLTVHPRMKNFLGFLLAA